jgi:hypothetical protein
LIDIKRAIRELLHHFISKRLFVNQYVIAFNAEHLQICFDILASHFLQSFNVVFAFVSARNHHCLNLDVRPLFRFNELTCDHKPICVGDIGSVEWQVSNHLFEDSASARCVRKPRRKRCRCKEEQRIKIISHLATVLSKVAI